MKKGGSNPEISLFQLQQTAQDFTLGVLFNQALILLSDI